MKSQMSTIRKIDGANLLHLGADELEVADLLRLLTEAPILQVFNADVDRLARGVQPEDASSPSGCPSGLVASRRRHLSHDPLRRRGSPGSGPIGSWISSSWQ